MTKENCQNLCVYVLVYGVCVREYERIYEYGVEPKQWFEDESNGQKGQLAYRRQEG